MIPQIFSYYIMLYKPVTVVAAADVLRSSHVQDEIIEASCGMFWRQYFSIVLSLDWS